MGSNPISGSNVTRPFANGNDADPPSTHPLHRSVAVRRAPVHPGRYSQSSWISVIIPWLT